MMYLIPSLLMIRLKFLNFRMLKIVYGKSIQNLIEIYSRLIVIDLICWDARIQYCPTRVRAWYLQFAT